MGFKPCVFHHILALFFLLLFANALKAQDSTFIFVDFGNIPSAFPWNNLDLPRSGSITQLLDQFGNSTGISLDITDPFNSINATGLSATNTPRNIPATASEDSFFGNFNEFASVIDSLGEIQLTNLDTSKAYRIELFASRQAGDMRWTSYTVIGEISEIQEINVSSNASDLAVFESIKPDSSGTILIQTTAADDNDNVYKFFYLGAMILAFEDSINVPDPILSLVTPNGSEYWQTDRSPEIRWESQGIDSVLIELSIDNGLSWQKITSVPAGQKRWQWSIPDYYSKQCLVRLTHDTLITKSSEAFTINNLDTTSCNIVVLGSSTAAGTGPTTKDSAWVWMYRDVLFQNDTRFQVTNLAKGGYTTFHLLPDSTIIPDSINIEVDLERNITKAISLHPDGIIINLPSNDAAKKHPVDQQLSNYKKILLETETQNVPTWITTPQPRAFDPERIQIQLDLLDSTFARFSPFVLDFWTGFHDTDFKPLQKFDSGDGVHLNNAGHRLLLERVLALAVDDYLLQRKNSTNIKAGLLNNFEIFPNPAKNQIEFKSDTQGHQLSVQIFNVKGQWVQSHDLEETTMDISNLPQGVYLITIFDNEDVVGTSKLLKK